MFEANGESDMGDGRGSDGGEGIEVDSGSRDVEEEKDEATEALGLGGMAVERGGEGGIDEDTGAVEESGGEGFGTELAIGKPAGTAGKGLTGVVAGREILRKSPDRAFEGEGEGTGGACGRPTVG